MSHQDKKPNDEIAGFLQYAAQTAMEMPVSERRDRGSANGATVVSERRDRGQRMARPVVGVGAAVAAVRVVRGVRTLS
jgi:hypothetical protein